MTITGRDERERELEPIDCKPATATGGTALSRGARQIERLGSKREISFMRAENKHVRQLKNPVG